MIRPDYSAVPKDLTELDQWVLWRLEDGVKIPRQPNGSGASTTNPSHCSEFSSALNVYHRRPSAWSGLGFVFYEQDPFVGIDLDDCLDQTGQPKPWAQGILERFADTYSEVSPSGRGVKIWARGKLPSAVGKVQIADGGIELYDRARYFAVTGRRFRGAPLEIEDHEADVLALHSRLSRSHTGGWHYNPNPDGRIPKGRQHLTLISLCGTLRKRGICDQAIRACLQEVNRHQCEQPGPPENIDRIVRSSARWRQPA